MASKYLQKFPIPSGFQQILSDFTRQVLRDQPTNIIQYAAKYFEMLQKGKKLQFDSKYNVKKDDKKYQLGYNPKNAQDITKKAGSITQKLNNKASISNKPVERQVSNHQLSQAQASNKEISGTQKTLNGQQISSYVNNLTTKFAQRTPSHHSSHLSNHQQQQMQQMQQTGEQNLMQNAVQQTVNILFDKFDTDQTGYLASKQIQRFVYQVTSQMNDDMQVNSGEIQNFINQVDKDKDGKISKSEMGKFIKKLLMGS